MTRVSPAKFRTILAFLKQQGYETISLKTLCNPVAVFPEKPIVITFDDSYESVYANAFPLMQEYGFLGTVFIITGYVGRINEWDVNCGGKKFS